MLDCLPAGEISLGAAVLGQVEDLDLILKREAAG